MLIYFVVFLVLLELELGGFCFVSIENGTVQVGV